MEAWELDERSAGSDLKSPMTYIPTRDMMTNGLDGGGYTREMMTDGINGGEYITVGGRTLSRKDPDS